MSLDRKAKRQEKKLEKLEKRTNKLKESNEKRMGLLDKTEKVHSNLSSEEWLDKRLDQEELTRAINEARQNLFIQRNKICQKIIDCNQEYAYFSTKPDSAGKKREMERCATGSKNAIYALAVVDQAIDRLDNIVSEHEWRQIIKDITKGYKTVNAISVGSDYFTKLAFLMQKAKLEMKGDISVSAMENYYGKPIDELLDEAQIDTKTASQLLVKDDVLKYDDKEDILDAVRYGAAYTVSPEEAARAVDEINMKAAEKGMPEMVPEFDEDLSNLSHEEIADMLGDLPSNL